MEWFKINDIYSYEIGIIVKELPPVTLPSKDIETININGRHGNVHIDKGTYQVVSKTIKCIIMDHSYIEEIKKVLNNRFGVIEFSNQTGRFFDYTIKNQIDFNTYLTFLNEFPLQLELQPLSKGVKVIEVLNSTKDIYVETDIETKPILKLEGKGKVIINDIEVEVFADNINIDCDLMICFYNDLLLNNKVKLNEFPFLKNGINKIELIGVNKLTIEYCGRWL